MEGWDEYIFTLVSGSCCSINQLKTLLYCKKKKKMLLHNFTVKRFTFLYNYTKDKTEVFIPYSLPILILLSKHT